MIDLGKDWKELPSRVEATNLHNSAGSPALRKNAS